MTIARSQIVDPDDSGIYHCINRCVRRAFLCGDEFEHRRVWIQERLRELASLFAIDVCGYAVMSNHLHVVLRTDPELPRRWSRTEIARRWLTLFPGPGGALAASETGIHAVRRLASDVDRIELLRDRLSSLSWFMRCLSEPIARRANREDNCRGRFWEGRFKCRRLLDETAVLACMVYVDLNPIRAKMAGTPETSSCTSVQDRIRVRQYVRRRSRSRQKTTVGATIRPLLARLPEGRSPRGTEDGIWLAPIALKPRRGKPGSIRHRSRGLLNMTLDAYLTVVDAVGRAIQEGNRGFISSDLKPILERLRIDEHCLVRSLANSAELFGSAMGSLSSLAVEASRRGRRWIVGALDVYTA